MLTSPSHLLRSSLEWSTSISKDKLFWLRNTKGHWRGSSSVLGRTTEALSGGTIRSGKYHLRGGIHLKMIHCVSDDNEGTHTPAPGPSLLRALNYPVALNTEWTLGLRLLPGCSLPPLHIYMVSLSRDGWGVRTRFWEERGGVMDSAGR